MARYNHFCGSLRKYVAVVLVTVSLHLRNYAPDGRVKSSGGDAGGRLMSQGRLHAGQEQVQGAAANRWS